MAVNLRQEGVFSEMDLRFAAFLTGISDRNEPELALAAALVSRATGDGNVCLDLSAVAGQPLTGEDHPSGMIMCPDRTSWIAKLRKWNVVGYPGDEAPLILDRGDRLYLFRYWEYEHLLAQRILEWSAAPSPGWDRPLMKKTLVQLFKTGVPGEIDWQKLAAFTAATRHFCVVSGGPGTGKSTVAANILTLVSRQARGEALRVALVAPTGKAAQRLQETVRLGMKKLTADEPRAETPPLEASTIHRLLGPISGSPYFRHHAGNPLPVDGVMVDEASMVDLPLMSKLVQALPLHCRLVLLGDQDQLASVEAGAVLGDLCDRGAPHDHTETFSFQYHEVSGETIPGMPGPPVQDSLVRLRKNYRFGSGSGIGILSHAINRGEGEKALELLKQGIHHDIRWVRLPDPAGLLPVIRNRVLSGYGAYLEAHDPEEAFSRFGSFQIICALRKGPYGVLALNRLVEQILEAGDLIRPHGRWYAGRPILITRNDYELGLFNGDVGLILPDPASGGRLRAFFAFQDGSVRKIHPVRLPEHETVFAMTVHKSQGSEFDRTLLLLSDRPSPLLTRELVYTGLTRARENVEVWGREAVFLEGVKRRIQRSSGLRDALWNR